MIAAAVVGVRKGRESKLSNPEQGHGAAVRRSWAQSLAATLPDLTASEGSRRLLCPAVWSFQPKAQRIYSRAECQIFVACLICGNFLVNIIEATIDPLKRKHQDTFKAFELFFNLAFTLELACNMYAFWFRAFWGSSWNIFDFVVVSIGLLTTFEAPLPGPLKLLRMMRAFRVFRLFKRIRSLKKIMKSLAKAIPGVVNAFVILVLVVAIYSILAVEFWNDFGAGGFYLNENSTIIEHQTSRGQDNGFEYFGNFPKAFYTMFQVMTTESWSEAVARPLIHGPDSTIGVATGIFFVSFQLLCGMILINVVVAVLLEKMVDDGSEGGETTTVEVASLHVMPSSLRANSSRGSEKSIKAPDDVVRKVSSASATSKQSAADLLGGVKGARLEKDVSMLREDMDDLRAKLCTLTALARARASSKCLVGEPGTDVVSAPSLHSPAPPENHPPHHLSLLSPGQTGEPDPVGEGESEGGHDSPCLDASLQSIGPPAPLAEASDGDLSASQSLA